MAFVTSAAPGSRPSVSPPSGPWGRSLLAQAMEPTALIQEEQEHGAEARYAQSAQANAVALDEGGLVSRIAAKAQQFSDWQLTELLAEGTWTRTFRAQPKTTGKTTGGDYAIKVSRLLPSAPNAQKELGRRFLLREAQVASQQRHRALVSVLGAQLDAAPRFLLIPYLAGNPLSSLIHNSASMTAEHISLPKLLWTIRQIAEGLVALHQAGWIHGNLKPSNILVSPEGQATLTDFCFSRRIDTAECESDGTNFGSVNYAAPEFFRSHGKLTPAVDIYALGVVLFEGACGQLPFSADRWEDVAVAHLRSEVPNICRINSQVPLKMAQVVRKMLAKEPLRRPTAAELVRLLVELEISALAEW